MPPPAGMCTELENYGLPYLPFPWSHASAAGGDSFCAETDFYPYRTYSGVNKEFHLREIKVWTKAQNSFPEWAGWQCEIKNKQGC